MSTAPRVATRRRASPGEIFTAFAAVLLGVSAFTGWYSGASEGGLTVSVLGWDSGTLGKLVLFAGIAVLLVLALRATGLELPPTFPVGAVASALGTIATIFVFVRVIDVPDRFVGVGRGVGLWISLAAGLAVVVAGLVLASEEV
ncbi:MAG: hypothetical protein U0R69_15850 [Gaiellales bacterium]